MSTFPNEQRLVTIKQVQNKQTKKGIAPSLQTYMQIQAAKGKDLTYDTSGFFLGGLSLQQTTPEFSEKEYKRT